MIEATKEAEDAWMEECVEIANGTLFTKIDSWINGANVEGKPVSVNFFMGWHGRLRRTHAEHRGQRLRGLRMAVPTR